MIAFLAAAIAFGAFLSGMHGLGWTMVVAMCIAYFVSRL
jgi:hypothetical protein